MDKWYQKSIAILCINAILVVQTMAYGEIVTTPEAFLKEIGKNGAQLNKTFKIEYAGDPNDFESMVNETIDEAFYLVDTYKGRHLNAWHMRLLTYSKEEATIIINADYWMNEEESYIVDGAIDAVLKAIIKPKMTELQKETAIVNFILSNTSYDHALSSYSAHDALIRKQAVCQGYATLFHRMATKAGLTTQMIQGKLKGTSHLWNLIKLEGKWYHVDTTNEDVNPGVFFNQSDRQMQQHDFTWDASRYPSVPTAYKVTKLTAFKSNYAVEVFNKIDLEGIKQQAMKKSIENQIESIRNSSEVSSEKIELIKDQIDQLKNKDWKEPLHLKLIFVANIARENRMYVAAYDEALYALEHDWSKANFALLEEAYQTLMDKAPSQITAKMKAEIRLYGSELR